MKRSRIRLALHAPLALVLLAGCASSPPAPTTDELLRAATGTEDAIVLDVTGGSVDAAGEPVGILTLAEAVRRSLTTDARIQSALSRVRIAQAQARQSWLWPNPILSVAIRFPEGGGSANIDAGLTADLVSLLQRRGRISVADSRLRAASAEAVTIVLDTLTEVQERYVAVQASDELRATLDARRTINERLLAVAQARLAVQEGTRLDVLTLQSQSVALDGQIAEQELDRHEQRLALSGLIGQPSGGAEWRVTPLRPAAVSIAEASQWLAAAIKNRPEVQSRRWELAALGAEQSLTRFAPGDGAEAGVAAERDPDWSAGPSVALPLPLFDFGQARRVKARAAVIEARHELTQAQRVVIGETRGAHASYLAARANLERVEKQLIPLEQRRRDQAEAQYKAGQTDITTLLIAEQDFATARTRLIQLEQRIAVSLLRLQRAVGGSGVAGPLQEAAPITAPASKPVQ
ncbi:MAG: TolC family protein [Tepidisphaeraceae bacterium]